MDQTNHEKTPKKLLLSGLGTRKTPISTPKNFTSRFLLLSNNKNLTPSPCQNRVVRNPFEHQHHEKLRLPVISSPSLFQPPITKQENKLELFEWTIEELSNLHPVNIVSHETQFSNEEIDPQFEEKAQAAISSFFQEQQIVPSPHVCILRKQKIVIKDESFTSNNMKIYNSTVLPDSSNINSNNSNNNTSAMISSSSFQSKNDNDIKRDSMTQTALSFPPNLPKEIEDLLQKYQINNEEDDLQAECNNDRSSMMDISTLRRKLFIQRPETPENDFTDETFPLNLSPAPKTPELTRISFMSSAKNNGGEEFEAINGDMFGELSPICNNDSSNNCSPVLSSNDISMISDVGRDCTPASRRCNKLKKKRLSESFSLLQNEFNSDESDDEKENFPIINNKDRRLFGRFDSGFENSDSNHTMNCSFSAEFMQI